MDPVAWLREEGYDPEGGLCEVIASKHNPHSQRTAMHAAAAAGELGVCRFLWEHGAASTIPTYLLRS